jgi:hypothetical protein
MEQQIMRIEKLVEAAKLVLVEQKKPAEEPFVISDKELIDI